MSTGTGTYTRTGVDINWRPIYKNYRYKGTIDGTSTKGEGNMILSFHNINQEWRVNNYHHEKVVC